VRPQLNERARLLRALDMDPLDRVPCVSPLQTGTVELMEQSGCSWPQAFRDPEQMYGLSRAGHDIAGLEGVRVPFDVTVEASALGASTGREGVDRQPSISRTALNDLEGLDRLEVVEPSAGAATAAVLSAVDLLSCRMEGVPVICGIVAPFMLACQMLSIEQTLMNIVRDPSFVRMLVRKAESFDQMYVVSALNAGADVITLIDAAASGDILSAQQYEEHALPSETGMALRTRFGGGRSVLHICGQTGHLLGSIKGSGATALSVDQCMDLAKVREILNGEMALIGNVSPTESLLFGTPGEVESESRACLEQGVNVLAPGCGLAPRTPTRNVLAMVRTAKGASFAHR
jgi:[methyl-Co(III) methanol-specific corrinoid protein]:coenzyme M methyltransferase